jgi:hypothetical protein
MQPVKLPPNLAGKRRELARWNLVAGKPKHLQRSKQVALVSIEKILCLLN